MIWGRICNLGCPFVLLDLVLRPGALESQDLPRLGGCRKTAKASEGRRGEVRRGGVGGRGEEVLREGLQMWEGGEGGGGLRWRRVETSAACCRPRPREVMTEESARNRRKAANATLAPPRGLRHFAADVSPRFLENQWRASARPTATKSRHPAVVFRTRPPRYVCLPRGAPTRFTIGSQGMPQHRLQNATRFGCLSNPRGVPAGPPPPQLHLQFYLCY